MRVLIATITVLLLAAWPLAATWAEDPPADPPADPPTTEEADQPVDDAEEDATTEENTEAEDGEPAVEEDVEAEPVPEGVRRRPMSGEQERRYKQRKTREDPFLNPPIGSGVPIVEGSYNPADWLREELYCGSSYYMVQDASGNVVGQASLAISAESDPVLGDFIRLRRHSNLDQPTQMELCVFAVTFKPRFKEVQTELADRAALPADPAPEGEVPELYDNIQRLNVDYLFDRMTVVHRVAGITSRRQIRQMPFSYDIDELPLLARQLRFREVEWPFEAVLCDPQHEEQLPMSIAEPVWIENVVSGDAERYDCYEFTIRIGNDTQTYLVERLPPHRLVRYTDGEYTYTLTDYLEQT
ncbi:hypothetical protein JW859_11065 [bacterium]|nr:hypothetical protein [bacterium]